MCGDSRYHRFWQCETFQFARNQLSPDVFALLPQLPESLTCFGWALGPATLPQWHSLLSQLPDPTPPLVGAHWKEMHLFTDGSCAEQHDCQLRFASWSVVFAGFLPEHSDTHVIASGVLPGPLQSAYRSEVFHSPSFACLWRFRKLLRGESLSFTWPHSDLWFDIAASLAGLIQPRCVSQKLLLIEAPQRRVRLRNGASIIMRWLIVRVRANFQRSVCFWQFYAKHTQACAAAAEITAQIHAVQLSVSQAVLALDDPPPGDAPVAEDVSLPPDASTWTGMVPLSFPPAAV